MNGFKRVVLSRTHSPIGPLAAVAANFAFTILSECTGTGATGYVPPAESECATALLNLAIRTTRGSRESEEGKDRGGTGEVNPLQPPKQMTEA